MEMPNLTMDSRALVEQARPSVWMKFRKHRWFALVVVLPTGLAILYYGIFASDMYVSESRFVIKSPNQKQQQFSTLANLIQTSGLSSGQEQTNEVLDYVRSRDALKGLQRQTDVKALFQSSRADFFSRYPAPFVRDRFENLYKYYDHMVDTRIDHDTETAVLTVKAFTPKDAHDINARLLDLSEGLVNRLNDRAQSRAISEAQRRVDQAEARLRAARVSLRSYRNDNSLLDPAKQATGVLDISNRLISEQAALRAQLQTIQQVAPANPSIPALQDRIAALGAQIAKQNGRAVGTDSGIATKLAQYENLAVEQEFATQMVNAANTSLEQARSEAQRQQFYLERVVDPNMPDLALLPKRLLQTLTVLAASILIYLIGWMLIVGILEHAPED